MYFTIYDEMLYLFTKYTIRGHNPNETSQSLSQMRQLEIVERNDSNNSNTKTTPKHVLLNA